MNMIGFNDSIIIEELMTLFVCPQVENNYTKWTLHHNFELISYLLVPFIAFVRLCGSYLTCS